MKFKKGDLVMRVRQKFETHSVKYGKLNHQIGSVHIVARHDNEVLYLEGSGEFGWSPHFYQLVEKAEHNKLFDI